MHRRGAEDVAGVIPQLIAHNGRPREWVGGSGARATSLACGGCSSGSIRSVRNTSSKYIQANRRAQSVLRRIGFGWESDDVGSASEPPLPVPRRRPSFSVPYRFVTEVCQSQMPDVSRRSRAR
jgi:hypothetical protein